MARQNHKAKWPATRRVKPWIAASGEFALAIRDPEDRLDKLTFAVARLGERGHRADARRLARQLDRDLAAHPDAAPAVRTVAEAYAAAGRRADARALYAAALGAARNDRRLKPAKRAARLASLRADAVDQGFADLFDDLTPAERAKVTFADALARADAALARGDLRSALAAAREAHRAAPGRDPARLLTLYAAAGDEASALRLLPRLEPGDRSVAIVGEPLLKLGLRKKVADLAAAEVRRELADAAAMDRPNYHHPAMAITAVAHFLLDHGERDLARNHLFATMKAARAWRTEESDWVHAAVYAHLAGAIARLDGPAAARPVFDHAAAGTTSGDTTALLAVVDAFRAAGDYDRALAYAARLRPADYRRRYTATVLAQAGRWKELAKVLATVKDPAEASDLAWWIAISLERSRSAP